ncbi:MAG: tyrosine-type recombinase/integrase [Limisphaerales bacterium]
MLPGSSGPLDRPRGLRILGRPAWCRPRRFEFQQRAGDAPCHPRRSPRPRPPARQPGTRPPTSEDGEGDSDPGTRIIPIGDAKRAIDTACRKAGLPHFHHHAFRHFFVSNAIEHGIDFKTIAAWVGHKDGGVLVAKTYGHLRNAHSTEMAKRMTFGAPPRTS